MIPLLICHYINVKVGKVSVQNLCNASGTRLFAFAIGMETLTTLQGAKKMPWIFLGH